MVVKDKLFEFSNHLILVQKRNQAADFIEKIESSVTKFNIFIMTPKIIVILRLKYKLKALRS